MFIISDNNVSSEILNFKAKVEGDEEVENEEITWFAVDDCSKQHLFTYTNMPKNLKPHQLSSKIILHPTPKIESVGKEHHGLCCFSLSLLWVGLET